MYGCAGGGGPGTAGWGSSNAAGVSRIALSWREPPVGRYPLQIRDVGFRLGLSRRGVVDDLALVRGDRIDPVLHEGREVHRQALEHRSHPLPTDLGSLVVVGHPRAVEVAADELHRVLELRQAQQTVGGALGRVVDVVEVRHRVRKDVQDLLDVVGLVRQDAGEVGQPVRCCRSASRCSRRGSRGRPTGPG